MSNIDILQNCVNDTKVNRFGSYFTSGKNYSPERIAESTDLKH